MATPAELLRAAEHMRGMLDGLRPAHKMMALSGIAVLEREAERLQAVEARQDGVCEICMGVGIRPGVPNWNDCAACGGHGRSFMANANSKRSWPDGWPPFAVLRRAYMLTGAGPTPSTKKCEGSGSFPWMARNMRSLWGEALSQVLKP